MYDSNTWQMCWEILFVWPYGGRLRAAVRCLAKICFFLVGRRSAVPLFVYPFIISFTFIFLHFFAGTPVCIGACRASRTFQGVVFCFFLVELQRWSPGREVERQQARFWQCSSSTSFSDKYLWSGAAFLHRWNIYAGEMWTDEILLLRYFEILQLRKLYVST